MTQGGSALFAAAVIALAAARAAAGSAAQRARVGRRTRFDTSLVPGVALVVWLLINILHFEPHDSRSPLTL